MRPSPRLLPITLLLGLAGCGTVYNLNAPPHVSGPVVGPELNCVPFGGVVRSGFCGVYGPLYGVWNLMYKDPVEGGKWFGLGVLAWADLPISLVGDVVTFPVAYARWKEAPWATWWGEPNGAELKFPPFGTPAAPPVSDGASAQVELESGHAGRKSP